MPVVPSANSEQSPSSTRSMRVPSCVGTKRTLFCRRDSLASPEIRPSTRLRNAAKFFWSSLSARHGSSASLPALSLQTVRRAPRPEPPVASHWSVRAPARCDSQQGLIRRRTARRRRSRTLRGTRIRDLRLNLQARSFATYRRIDAVGHTATADGPTLGQLLYKELVAALRAAACGSEKRNRAIESERTTRATAILFALEARLDSIKAARSRKRSPGCTTAHGTP
jgi:hypothetical protein